MKRRRLRGKRMGRETREIGGSTKGKQKERRRQRSVKG